MCVIVRRGDPIAGQIWIELDHLDGTCSLFAPASTLAYLDEHADRLFECRLSRAAAMEIRTRLDREAEFDPDFWLIGLETRSMDIDIPLAKE